MPTRRSFRELQDLWYAKLADKGFKDIEKRVGTKSVLIRRTMPINDLSLVSEYFEGLQRGYLAAKFPKRRDKRILGYRVEGWLIQDIATKLDINRKTVREVIQKYEKLWGLRK